MKQYLALTNQPEYWSQDGELILLGPWDFGAQRKALVGRQYKKFEYVDWGENSKENAFNFDVTLYEKTLPLLAKCLNELHQVAHSYDYWRILVGPWLLQFIGNMQDRTTRLLDTLNQYPNACCRILPAESADISTETTLDYNLKIVSDDYNLKLYSHILREFKKGKIEIINDYRQALVGANISKKFKRKIKTWLLDLINVGVTPDYFLYEMYHARLNDLLKLKVTLNIGGVYLSPTRIVDIGPRFISRQLREKLFISTGEGEIEKLICHLIPLAMPKCYIENYSQWSASCAVKQVPKLIISAVGWNNDEYLKFYAANARERGAQLAEIQHGSGFNMYKLSEPEVLAKDKDIFFIWGAREGFDKKTQSLPDPYLCRIHGSGRGGGRSIVFVSTNLPLYQYRVISMLYPENFEKYFNDKKIFLNMLPPEILAQIVYRPYPEEYGMDEAEKIKQAYPQIPLARGKSLINIMRRAKIVVIDHAQTSALEALTINVPTILFWDHDVYRMTKDAEWYFAEWRRVGVLYRTPGEAARKLIAIFSNPLLWWQGSEIQRVRQQFCKKFTIDQKDWLRDWIQKFKKV